MLLVCFACFSFVISGIFLNSIMSNVDFTPNSSVKDDYINVDNDIGLL